jgi:hypothetical protein
VDVSSECVCVFFVFCLARMVRGDRTVCVREGERCECVCVALKWGVCEAKQLAQIRKIEMRMRSAYW